MGNFVLHIMKKEGFALRIPPNVILNCVYFAAMALRLMPPLFSFISPRETFFLAVNFHSAGTA